MGKSYHYIKAMQQPDQTSCWSTTMAWWTKAIPSINDKTEIEILGMFHHLTGSDGGLKFPDGFKTMLEDEKWGLTVETMSSMGFRNEVLDNALKKGPIICGYWDYSVGGYHAVALYNYKNDEIWAMDPNGGVHIKRELSHYLPLPFKRKHLVGYRK